MIRSIEIMNFRCFRHLKLDDCKRVNVIVGDNGSGKTALLEAMFLPLGASTEIAMRLRQQRGLDATFVAAPPRRIEEALWREFFYRHDFKHPVTLRLNGDGPEARSLTISRGTPGQLLGLDDRESAFDGTFAPLILTWRDASGIERRVPARLPTAGPLMPDTGEELPDFFHFAATQPTSSIENAGRFSDLSRKQQHPKFLESFTKEYKWIKDINIEVIAGTPALFATVEFMADKIPLANISGGINRVVAILLAIASRPKSIVLVDEIENGIFYRHHGAIWRSLLNFVRDYDSQLFTTTHSGEWLEALIGAADNKFDDISVWRIERGEKQPVVRQFSGESFRAGIETGGELR